MAPASTARPAAPTSSGAVRFCWKSQDAYGRIITKSVRARDCPDVAKARAMIEEWTECETWVETAR